MSDPTPPFETPPLSPPASSRDIVVEREVAAPPPVVWEALTDAEQLRRWFPLDARVTPGEGGSIWLSWGPGVEAEAPIHVWQPPSRFGWTESYGDDEQGRPIKVAVDFYIEGRGGSTFVRLVQSGFSAGADWDEMYDAITDGWTYFLFNLAFYLERHAGRSRGMAWNRFATDLSREAVWDRLFGGSFVTLSEAEPGAPFELMLERSTPGEVVSARRGFHFAGTLPGLADAVIFIEIEGKHVGVWLSLYGADQTDLARLQQELNASLNSSLKGGS